jgi:RNA polymerase sigma-70 factor, ECF subfamily
VSEAEEITKMLQAVRAGDSAMAEKLMNAVYTQLHKVAKRYMAAERPGHTLQPTAVVNEVCLRLFPAEEAGKGAWKSVPIDWQSRAHFLGVAARQMRQVLVDHARQKRAVKRNFGIKISMGDADPGALALQFDEDIQSIDHLLTLLATKDPDVAKVVELKFFGGLSTREAAFVMGTNTAKVRRDWEFARSWLRQRLERVSPERVEKMDKLRVDYR